MKNRSLIVPAVCVTSLILGLWLSKYPPRVQPVQAPVADKLENALTAEPSAKISFMRGLRLYFAYNPAAAFLEFKRAARADKHFAMAWWGMSISSGGNLNVSSTPMRLSTARAAAARARDLLPYASPLESGYVKAIAARFGDNGERPHEYAKAMERVASDDPSDVDAQVLYAEALLESARGLGTTGVPESGTAQSQDLAKALEVLQSAFARTHHAGAAHLIIHAAEFLGRPQTAIGAANWLYHQPRLAAQSHLLHMSAHIFMDTGRLKDAAAAAEEAVMIGEPSRRALSSYDARSFYRAHNIDLALYSLVRSANIAQARTFANAVPDSDGPIEIALLQGNDRLVLRTALAPTLASYFAHCIADARLGNGERASMLARVIRQRLGAQGIPDAALYSDFVDKSVTAELGRKRGERARSRSAFALAARAKRALPKSEVPNFFYYRLPSN